MAEHRTIKASEFKAKCLRLMDEVAEGGPEIVVTKRGRPVSRLEVEAGPRPRGPAAGDRHAGHALAEAGRPPPRTGRAPRDRRTDAAAHPYIPPLLRRDQMTPQPSVHAAIARARWPTGTNYIERHSGFPILSPNQAL